MKEKLITKSSVVLQCPSAVAVCFRLFRCFPNLALEWDFVSETLSIEGPSCHRYQLWIINQIISVGVITCSSCMFMIVRPAEFPVTTILFSVLFLLIALFDVEYSWVMFHNCEDISLGFRRMKVLLEKLTYHTKLKRRTNWKLVSTLSKYLAWEMLLLAFFGPLIFVLEELDPYAGIMNHAQSNLLVWSYPPCGTILNIALIIVRVILMTLFMSEAARLFSTFVVIMLHWVEMQSTYLLWIQGNLRFTSDEDFHRKYIQFRIALQTWEIPYSDWIRSMMTIFFCLIVLCNITAVKYPDKIPFLMYIFVLDVSIADFFTISVTLPFFTDSHESTQKILLEKRKIIIFNGTKISLQSRKVASRQLRSLRPVAVKCGSSFILKKSTKSAFYNEIVQATMNGVLIDL